MVSWCCPCPPIVTSECPEPCMIPTAFQVESMHSRAAATEATVSQPMLYGPYSNTHISTVSTTAPLLMARTVLVTGSQGCVSSDILHERAHSSSAHAESTSLQISDRLQCAHSWSRATASSASMSLCHHLELLKTRRPRRARPPTL